jgi:hypothetical protein
MLTQLPGVLIGSSGSINKFRHQKLKTARTVLNSFFETI